MKDEDTRNMFTKWIEATWWSATGIDLTPNYIGEFDQPYENMYLAYAAGIRKGAKMQKEKSKSTSRKD